MACAGLLALGVAFWTAALLAGIALANRVLAWSAAIRGSGRGPARLLPRPPLPLAITIAASTGLASVLIVVGADAADLPRGFRRLILPAYFLMTAGVLAWALRTPFSRACVAVLFQFLIYGVLLTGLVTWLVLRSPPPPRP